MPTRNPTAAWLVTLSILLTSTALLLSIMATSQASRSPCTSRRPTGRPGLATAKTNRQEEYRPIDRRTLAGSYRNFDGFQGNALDLWPDGTYRWLFPEDVDRCEGFKSFGVWTVRTDGAIAIEPTDSKRKLHALTEGRLLYPVRWGRRLYLIPKDRFEDFRDAIAASAEPCG